jgi:hypothetical protein
MKLTKEQYARKMEREEAARKVWNESERILNILRTETAKPLKQFTPEEILLWHQKLQN